MWSRPTSSYNEIRAKLFKGLMIAVVVICISFYMVTQLFNTTEREESVVIDDRPSVEEFIGEIAETARDLGADNDLYASVMIAQAILESEHGQSGLGSAPNYNLLE